MATQADQLAKQATEGKPSPEEVKNNPATPDARDTNAPLPEQQGDSKEKVAVQLADGSTKEQTVGALAKDHGEPIRGGISVAELNPAYYPAAETATEGAQ